MSELKEVFAAYKKLSFTDRIVFYTTLSNTVNVHEDNIQDFLIETRIADGNTCIYCEGSHVVKNGKRKDGIQRINAYHSSLKSFIDRFHGVSTKHLEHYIIWNNLIANNKRSKTENISLMFVQIMSRRLTVHNSDISARPPLSFVT